MGQWGGNSTRHSCRTITGLQQKTASLRRAHRHQIQQRPVPTPLHAAPPTDPRRKCHCHPHQHCCRPARQHVRSRRPLPSSTQSRRERQTKPPAHSPPPHRPRRPRRESAPRGRPCQTAGSRRGTPCTCRRETRAADRRPRTRRAWRGSLRLEDRWLSDAGNRRREKADKRS